MEASMKVNGSKICKMDWAKKHGKINRPIRDSTSKDKNTGKVLMFGQTAVFTVVIGRIIRLMEKAPTSGLMEEFM